MTEATSDPQPDPATLTRAEGRWAYDRPPAGLSEAVQVAVGGASACWENLGGAGVFQSDRALEISDALIAWIEDNYVTKVEAMEQAQQAVGNYQRKYVDRAGRTHEL